MTFVLNNSKAGKMAQEFLKKNLKITQKNCLIQENELKKEETNLLGKKNCFKQRRIFKEFRRY